MKPMPNGPPVTLWAFEGEELDHDGDAEGGDREIVGAQPQGDRADESRREPAPIIAPIQPTKIGRP